MWAQSIVALQVTPQGSSTPFVSRKTFFNSIAASVVSASLVAPANAEGSATISDEQLKEVVKSDIMDRQFLVTGQLTRSVYDPSATFTDEIDTQKLFVGEKSQVRLVGDVQVSKEKVEFRFDEDLMFRIPLRPVVSLTGKVVLARDPDSGLIKSYQEFWDQDVWTVVKSAKI